MCLLLQSVGHDADRGVRSQNCLCDTPLIRSMQHLAILTDSVKQSALLRFCFHAPRANSRRQLVRYACMTSMCHEAGR